VGVVGEAASVCEPDRRAEAQAGREAAGGQRDGARAVGHALAVRDPGVADRGTPDDEAEPRQRDRRAERRLWDRDHVQRYPDAEICRRDVEVDPVGQLGAHGPVGVGDDHQPGMIIDRLAGVDRQLRRAVIDLLGIQTQLRGGRAGADQRVCRARCRGG
jgi:hypothetical protein